MKGPSRHVISKTIYPAAPLVTVTMQAAAGSAGAAGLASSMAWLLARACCRAREGGRKE